MGELVGKGSKYSDIDRMRAVTSYAIHGVGSIVSKELGISETTLCDWRKSDWWESALQEVRSEKSDHHIALYHQIATEGARQALEKLPEASAKDAMIISATATDKARLLMNQPTSIKGDSSSIQALADQFAKLSEQWNEKQANVVSTQHKDSASPSA